MRYQVNKRDLAAAFGVSTQAIDGWLLRGCPAPQRRGRETFFDLSAVLSWRLLNGQRYRSALHGNLMSAADEMAWIDVAWLTAFVAAPELLPDCVDGTDMDEHDQLVAWRERLAAHPDARDAMREFAEWLLGYLGADRTPPFPEGLRLARSLNQPGA